MSKRIHELAIPKGDVVPPCEICKNKATTKCEDCRVTHYCSEDHKLNDLKAFHRSVCNLMLDLKKERPIPFSESERRKEKNDLLQKKIKIYNLAETTARKWLLQRNPEMAYPPALIALNIAEDVWTHDSPKILYPMCLVAEVFLGLEDLKAAQDYMITASWTSHKFDVIPSDILSQLQRLRGIVYMATKLWNQAKESFTKSLHATEEKHGKCNIRMANRYGYLGLSQLNCENMDNAMDSFHTMCDKWLKHLLAQYESKTLRMATDLEMETDSAIKELEFEFMESRNVLQWMYEEIRQLGMTETTDLIMFKILCVQVLSQMRNFNGKDALVFKEEALAIATRTKQDKAVKKSKIKLMFEVLGDNYLLRWERKNNRPRTVATKYLELIKAIDI